MEGYYYLNQSSVHEVKGVSDDKRFHDLQNEFDVYITREESGWVFRVLSIVLNAGNLRFRKEETKNNEEIAVITNKQFLKNIA